MKILNSKYVEKLVEEIQVVQETLDCPVNFISIHQETKFYQGYQQRKNLLMEELAQLHEIDSLLSKGISVTQIAKQLDISASNIYTILKKCDSSPKEYKLSKEVIKERNASYRQKIKKENNLISQIDTLQKEGYSENDICSKLSLTVLEYIELNKLHEKQKLENKLTKEKINEIESLASIGYTDTAIHNEMKVSLEDVKQITKNIGNRNDDKYQTKEWKKVATAVRKAYHYNVDFPLIMELYKVSEKDIDYIFTTNFLTRSNRLHAQRKNKTKSKNIIGKHGSNIEKDIATNMDFAEIAEKYCITEEELFNALVIRNENYSLKKEPN